MQLAEYLKTEDLTAKAFAQRIGVDASMVTRWSARKTVPKPENIRSICSATRGLVTANDFIATEADLQKALPAPAEAAA